MSKAVILTGPPSSGKTSVIEILAAQGYATVPEQARLLIEKQGPPDIKNKEKFHAFQDQILERIIAEEENISPEKEFVFLDRGRIDNIAYSQVFGHGLPKDPRYFEGNYHSKVFLFDPLPLIQDGTRYEKKEDISRIHQFLKKTYTRYQYTIIPVPTYSQEKTVEKSIEKRAEHILTALEK